MSGIWPLPFAIPDDVADKAKAISLVIFDVDGVLTDGSLVYGPDGEKYKRFHVRDGQGIRLLRESGLEVAVISARSSPALTTRAGELGIRHLETGVEDKLEAFRSLAGRCGLDQARCCYVGDDLVDIPVILQCGLGIAVADAHHAVRHVAHWVTPSAGGCGAAREVCDAVLYAQRKFDDIMDRHMKFSTTP